MDSIKNIIGKIFYVLFMVIFIGVAIKIFKFIADKIFKR